MKIKQFIVDAFTDKPFGGNPAAVCMLDEWIPSQLMQQIAAENNLAETAFLVKKSRSTFDLKWFTPRIEMDLCGHATLASAHVLWNHLDYEGESIRFLTNSGELSVENKNGNYALDFPSRMPVESSLPKIIHDSINIEPQATLKSRDYLLVFNSEKEVKEITFDRSTIKDINLDPGGIIVTAAGDKADFVSRFFTPQSDLFEDPVTGSAHCSLIPYWSRQLNRDKMVARQLSQRGGTLYCEDRGSRVLISGKSRTFSEGIISV